MARLHVPPLRGPVLMRELHANFPELGRVKALTRRVVDLHRPPAWRR